MAMKNIYSIILFIIVVNSNLCLSQTDLATGFDVVENNHVILTSVAGNRGVNGGRILWDTSHGIYVGYSPTGRYSGWKNLMETFEREVLEDSTGVLNLDLSGFDVLIINVVSSWDSPYTINEITEISSFVSDGGTLVFLSDNSTTHVENINPICNFFGSATGISEITPLDLVIQDFINHPIFQDVNQIFYRAAGEISSIPPSEVVAWTDADEPILAIARYGSGKVLFTGDVNFMDNTYINNLDNQLFTENIFDWALQPRVAPVPTLSSIGLLLFGFLLTGFSLFFSRKTKTH